MPRRPYAKKRKLPPDPIYNSVLVHKLINKVLRKGKKSLAERICYNAFHIIRERTNEDPMHILKEAVKNVSPMVEVRPRRLGGATYQIPIEVRKDRKVSLALRWIVNYARQRKGKPMEEKLASELIDAFNKTGAAYKKKEDTHKMAEANRAFARYRW